MTLHIHPSEFAKRREKLLQSIGMGNIGVIFTSPEFLRNGDTHYPYRPDSNFYYLTGFSEPEAIAVFIPGRAEGEYILFCRARNPEKEVWDGPRIGPEQACAQYGAQQAFPIETFVTHQAGFYAGRQSIELLPLIAEMRMFKSPGEIQLMRQAAEISAQAHQRAMQICRPGLNEYHLEAELIHTFTQNSARFVAYPSIVAGGKNACTLHYIDNNMPLKDGELVLVDAGCEYQYYASDITRTFPINGRFNPRQRDIYNVVLEAQLAVIQQIRPGLLWNEMHATAVRVLTKGLTHLGILKSGDDLKKFFMHGTGHFIGLDVHDVGERKINDTWRPLEPGMILTVEPGIYIEELGIGIRIEDDVLVTPNGSEVLSAALPKTADAIEAVMGR